MHRLCLFLACLLPAFLAMSAETNSSPAKATLPPKAKLRLYLLMGQSNMAGRGEPEAIDLTPHPRVLMFNLSNEWVQAVEPVNKGEPKKTAGVGPGLAFGKAMAEQDTNVIIGLVPCAIGGTPLMRWVKGADLYERAVTRARAAMEAGTLAGVIWHQGESDAKLERDATTYGARLETMVNALRADLQQPELPFVAGQIGEFLYDRDGNPLPFSRTLNAEIASFPAKVAHTGCALAKDLKHKGDELHFDSASERELGRRFAVEMQKLTATKK